MKARHVLILTLCLSMLAGCFRTTVRTPLPVIVENAPPVSTFPTATPLPDENARLNFTATLQSGAWTKYVLGPASEQTGYVVDITPQEPSVNGAHIEHKILPEYDGEMWNDVLWMLLPEPAEPLRVNVHAYLTNGWPVAYQGRLNLEPGVWHGFVICDSSQAGGYVIEIDPQGTAPYQAGIERSAVQPEFSADAWLDVLRIMASPNQPVLPAEVRVYRTPDLPILSEFDIQLTPGDWTGTSLQESSAQAGYVVEVTPLDATDNQIERFVVQPEFNGTTWNDVLRLLVPADRPPMRVHVRVYVVTE
jgi:hypothetical protein